MRTRKLRERNPIPEVVGSCLATALLLALAAGSAHAEAATLLSARGEVRAEGAGAPRDLGARDTFGAGERLVTGADAGAALAVGDLHVQVGPGSRLAVGPDGSLELERGTLRVVDLGDGSREAVVRTPHAVVRAAGADTEVEAGAAATRVRQGDGSARVARVDATGTTELPEDHEARVDAEGVTVASGAAPRLALGGADVDVAVATHFQPADVAAPPSTVSLFPFDPDKRVLNPCDSPGSGCGGSPQLLVQPSAPGPSGAPDFGFGTGPADPPDPGFGTGPADPPGPQVR